MLFCLSFWLQSRFVVVKVFVLETYRGGVGGVWGVLPADLREHCVRAADPDEVVCAE